MLPGIITQGPAFSHRGAHRWNCRIELSLPGLQKERLSVKTLSCFPTSIKFTLMSLKNIICSDDRLSQGQDIGHCCEMRAFWHSSESLAPSVPLPEVRLDGGPGRLFSFLFGIPDLASIAVWWGGWFGMTCFVPCSAAKPRHNLLWLTYCIAGSVLCCRADGFKMNFFAICASYWARCCLLLSPLLVQNLDVLFNTQ